MLIRSRAYKQEEEKQHSVLPASALQCGAPLPNVDCVLTSLPALLVCGGAMASKEQHLAYCFQTFLQQPQHDQQTQSTPAQTPSSLRQP